MQFLFLCLAGVQWSDETDRMMHLQGERNRRASSMRSSTCAQLPPLPPFCPCPDPCHAPAGPSCFTDPHACLASTVTPLAARPLTDCCCCNCCCDCCCCWGCCCCCCCWAFCCCTAGAPLVEVVDDMGRSGPEAGSERKAVRLSLTQPSTVAVAELLALPLAPLPLLLDCARRCA